MNIKDSTGVLNSIISMVPQWYKAAFGPNELSISWKNETQPFYCLSTLTPRLSRLLTQIRLFLLKVSGSSLASNPSFCSLVQEHIAVDWLESFEVNIKWNKLISYLNSVASRTYENNQVSVNLILTPGKKGERYIDYPERQKIFDQLASSPFTYFRLDHSCRILDYCEVPWGKVKESMGAEYHPSFLHPIHSVLKSSEISAHVTASGDIIIMNKEGLIASKRKGQWKLYETKTLRSCITKCLGDYASASNLFQVLFDLSFRRHGALLVYDPKMAVMKHLANKESILRAGQATAHSIIAPALEDIAVGDPFDPISKRRLFAEIASIDGAVIFNSEKILAAGAVVKSADEVSGNTGARSTAAASAFKYGGYPMKISSDGEVTLYFKSTSKQGSCDAKMEFL